MSTTQTPKGTPIQRSPSSECGGTPSALSPQHPDAQSMPFTECERRKLVSSILQSPSFREELDTLIQDQVRKGGSSSSLWALRQIADFMTSHESPATLPVSTSSMTLVTPINDMQGWEPGSMVKGERLMRCKLASTYRLMDLYGWAQLSPIYLTLRVSKEQEHFLVLPDGLAYAEATASNLVKVNILGEVVERGSTALGVDVAAFGLHSAIYSARPDVRCLLHINTPATAAVSAMKCGLLPLSHEALLVGDVAYFDYTGLMEDKEDRVELQKSLGPTCKVLVLRNHGIVALGESVEEAFYSIYHIQAACQIQVSALCSSGGEENLIMLDRATHKPSLAGTVGWAGSTFGPLHKSRLGEHEFEALMRTLDNLGFRTGYTYRFPVLLERSRTRREVEVPATVTSFSFDEEGVRSQARTQQHTQRQQQERTRWLNTPNSYQRVSQEQASPGHQRTMSPSWPVFPPVLLYLPYISSISEHMLALHNPARRNNMETTTRQANQEKLLGKKWQKTEEITQGSGTAIKIDNSNQFVPLFTNPQEVLETRNKIREQNRYYSKTAGPQSQVLAGVIIEKSLQPTEGDAAGGQNAQDGDPSMLPVPPEPEPPNPFSQLTDKELEEYKKEVQKKQQLGLEDGEEEMENEKEAPNDTSAEKCPTPTNHPAADETEVLKTSHTPNDAIQNGREEDQQQVEELEKGMKALSTTETSTLPPKSPPTGPTAKPAGVTPDGSPSKSPSKKKKKFKAPSFLKKSKKQKEKVEA